MQKALQHLMDLVNHLSSEGKAYLWSVGSSWASLRITRRGLPSSDRTSF
jgi:hypothetical protein